MDPLKAARTGRIGLVVNPIAGLGGRVALKGSDGAAVQHQALALGAVPEAGDRARRALEALGRVRPNVQLLTAPGAMGASAAAAAGLAFATVGEIAAGATTAEDTRRIARAIRDAGVDLLLFAGGDGTARDIHDAIGHTVPVLGIPAGVKVYSAVFAVNPSRAGELAAAVLTSAVALADREVLDLDEDAYRAGRVSPALHGYLRVPYRRESVQGGKEPAPLGDQSAADAIARDLVWRLRPDQLCILGPGTTTRAIARRLGVDKTLAGVDLIRGSALVIADATEHQLATAAAAERTWVVVTPIGGQGFLFGRGIPQIGPAVLRHVRREDILVVATTAKLAALHGQPLLVDTGDAAVDASLAGYLPVITGYRESTPYRIAA